MSEYKDITQHEIEALKMEYNLADAHTHQSQSSSQEKIVDSLPQLWRESEKKKQAELETKFIEAFFTSQKQPTALQTPTILVYSASVGMVMIANYLKKKDMSVALLHPCFDNIRDILRNMDVPVEPLEESWLHESNQIYENLKNNVKSEAIFLVDPNNPTGFTLTGSATDPKETKKSFLELFRYAKDYNKLLIFDFCFASFLLPGIEWGIFDIYKEMENAGIEYITTEDSGKIWPLQDAKIAMIKTSKGVYKDLYNIGTSYLLNTSPFILNLVSSYIQDSMADNFESVHGLLDRNRNIAKKELSGSLLEFQEPKSRVSIAWFKIKDPNIKATDLQKAILKKGVYVLPGTYFYWNNPPEGERYIRIALARNTEVFEPAVKLIREALNEYPK